MSDNIFELYATKKASVEILEKELAELKDLIIGYMKEKDLAVHETPWGRFNLQGRASWTYSPAIEKAQEEVKALKKAEEESGIAKSMTLPVLVLKK
jgi:hypothetical protein